MAWIVVSIILALIGSIGLLIGIVFKGKANRNAESRSAMGFIVCGVTIVLFGLLTAFASIKAVPAGEVGVKYRFGAITGQVGEGLHFIAPWTSLHNADIRVQRHFFEKLDSFSKETQDVFVAATLNIRVSPQAIQELYRNVGPRYFEILVAPRVAQNFKDETVKYLSTDIAPNREQIRQAVKTRLEQELAPSSIEVVDLLLENIDFRPEFKQAIENKQIATQNALEAQQRVAQAEYQAQSAVKTAEGQGQSILVVAQKQAEANKALSASLSPELIQYTLTQKLGPGVTTILLPTNQPFILGSDVLAPAK